MKEKVLISFGILYLILSVIFTLNFFDVFHTLPIVTLNDLSATQYEERTDISYIKNIKYGKIKSKPKKVDTTTPGKKRIILTIENNYGYKREYQFFVNVEKKE